MTDQRGIFDGLHKGFKNGFERIIPTFFLEMILPKLFLKILYKPSKNSFLVNHMTSLHSGQWGPI